MTLAHTFPQTSLLEGFVYLHSIHPDIRISNRYHSQDNFLGRPFPHYFNNVLILSTQAAKALLHVQETVSKDGFDLVIYDGYRPQTTVNAFVTWAEDITDQTMKTLYYPRVDKEQVFELGYIAKRSSHTRGSTVDLTLIKKNKPLQPTRKMVRQLNDGFAFTYLDDDTVDMHTHVDLFDKASHHDTDLVPEQALKWRNYLRSAMVSVGFTPYKNEWWHYTLAREPFPDTYFDFPVR